MPAEKGQASGRPRKPRADAERNRNRLLEVATTAFVFSVAMLIGLAVSSPPSKSPAPLLPWFKAPRRASSDVRIVFGHWSALGFYRADNVTALDTGCVWGGALSALNLDAPKSSLVSVPSLQPRASEE